MKAANTQRSGGGSQYWQRVEEAMQRDKRGTKETLKGALKEAGKSVRPKKDEVEVSTGKEYGKKGTKEKTRRSYNMRTT